MRACALQAAAKIAAGAKVCMHVFRLCAAVDGRQVAKATPALRLARNVRMIQTMRRLLNADVSDEVDQVGVVGRGNLVFHKRTKSRRISGDSWDSRRACVGRSGSARCESRARGGFALLFVGLDEVGDCVDRRYRIVRCVSSATQKCNTEASIIVSINTLMYEINVGTMTSLDIASLTDALLESHSGAALHTTPTAPISLSACSERAVNTDAKNIPACIGTHLCILSITLAARFFVSSAPPAGGSDG